MRNAYYITYLFLFGILCAHAQQECVQNASTALPEKVKQSHQRVADTTYRASSDGYYEQRVHCDCGDPRLVIRNKDMNIVFSGYIKSNNFFDSRQVFGLREDIRAILPEPKSGETSCGDINDRAQFHMLALETRLRTLMSGPKVGSADASAFVEVDFTGPWVVDGSRDRQVGFQDAVNGAVLRHAYIRLASDRYSFLAGQFWHPMVPPESAVHDTVTFETSPFESVSRNPQIRFTAQLNHRAELILAMMSQLVFRCNGPEGFASKYLRNAVLPNLHAQLRTYWGDHVFGVGVDYKRLLPRLKTVSDDDIVLKARNTIGAVSSVIYGQLAFEKVVTRAKLTYASNLTDHLMLGGYGVKSIDTCTNAERYTAMRHLAFLFDIYFPNWTIEPGLMIGVSKNLGARSSLFEDTAKEGNDRYTVYGFGGGEDGLSQDYNAIDYVFGLAPRIKWHKNPITIAAEVEWLRAAYGTFDCKGDVQDTCPVNNVRFTFAVYYCF